VITLKFFKSHCSELQQHDYIKSILSLYYIQTDYAFHFDTARITHNASDKPVAEF